MIFNSKLRLLLFSSNLSIKSSFFNESSDIAFKEEINNFYLDLSENYEDKNRINSGNSYQHFPALWWINTALSLWTDIRILVSEKCPVIS